MKLSINNLQFNNHTLTCELEDGYSYGIFSLNHNDTDSLLLQLSGINKSDSIYYNENIVFDNKEYFKNRLYLDFNQKYFNTLNLKSIHDLFKRRFKKNVDEKQYKKIIEASNIRNEILVNEDYKFTQYGINLQGLCLLESLTYDNIIINNPINYVRNDEIKSLIVKVICNKRFKNVIVDATSIKDFVNDLDYIILIGDYKECYVINPKLSKFIISDDNLYIQDKIYNRGNICISLAKSNTEEKKRIFGRNKHKEIFFKDVLEFLGDNYDQKD